VQLVKKSAAVHSFFKIYSPGINSLGSLKMKQVEGVNYIPVIRPPHLILLPSPSLPYLFTSSSLSSLSPRPPLPFSEVWSRAQVDMFQGFTPEIFLNFICALGYSGDFGDQHEALQFPFSSKKIYIPRRDGRLSWPSRWLVTHSDGLPVRRQSPIQVVTGQGVEQLR